MRRTVFRSLTRLALASILATSAAPRAEEVTFLGADMRLYFEGPVIETAISAQSIILVYLPVTKENRNRYDPMHNAIAQQATRLSKDIQIVPLTGLYPAPNEHAQNWLRAVQCARKPSILPAKDRPVLYFSFSEQSRRRCIGVASTGEQSNRLISLMRDLEESNCTYNEDFKDAVLNWMTMRSDAQYHGAALETFGKLTDMLGRSARTLCSSWASRERP